MHEQGSRKNLEFPDVAKPYHQEQSPAATHLIRNSSAWRDTAALWCSLASVKFTVSVFTGMGSTIPIQPHWNTALLSTCA